MLPQRLGADVFDELDAIHIWHVQVGNHHLNGLRDFTHGVGAVASLHYVVPRRGESEGDRLPHADRMVYGEYRFWHVKKTPRRLRNLKWPHRRLGKLYRLSRLDEYPARIASCS